MRRILLAVVLLGVAFVAGRCVWRATASDATKIRWLLEDEAAAFNSCSALSVLASFAPEWRDETTGTSRQLLHGGILWVFRNRRDAAQRFLFRIELGETDIQVDGDQAKATLAMALYEGLDAYERCVWELRVVAHLARRDGGWLIERSSHETIRGTVPR
ncbi:MAG: hypothetical protein IPK26_02680 [Planctomycetes bacterium]|nr:hypothetical protein [Planctomycetota bacterium]